MPTSSSKGVFSRLDSIGMRMLWLDFAGGVLFAPTQAVLEMGGALAKKGFEAADTEIAFLTSGQSAGLILSFFIAHLATKWRKMPLVAGPEIARSIALMGVFFLPAARGSVLWFVTLHALAQMFQSMTVPARVTIYRLSYPAEIRGIVVGYNRQAQYLIATVVSLGVSALLDGNIAALLPGWFPRGAASGSLVIWSVALIGFLGLLGTLVFAFAPVREDGLESTPSERTLVQTIKAFAQVWREDREFRKYESFFFIFGFANIMTIPLTQIHAVDWLKADYLDLAMINVAIVQGLMALTMPLWGRLVDRHSPSRLRGFINLIFAFDFLALAVAPDIKWVYVGRICRGIALGGGTLVWMLGSLHYAKSPERAPIYLGMHTVLTGVRWLMAPFAGVYLKHAFGNDARPVFAVVYIVVVSTALLMIHRWPMERRREPHVERPMPAPRITGA